MEWMLSDHWLYAIAYLPEHLFRSYIVGESATCRPHNEESGKQRLSFKPVILRESRGLDRE